MLNYFTILMKQRGFYGGIRNRCITQTETTRKPFGAIIVLFLIERRQPSVSLEGAFYMKEIDFKKDL